MVVKLPNPTSTAILVAGVVSTGVWVWTASQPVPAAEAAPRQTSQNTQISVSPDEPQKLLRHAILTLERRPSVSAKIRQKGSMFGQDPIGSGFYLQQLVGSNLLFRLDLRTQLGEQSAIVAHVCDDQGQFWQYEKTPGNKAAISRIDVQTVKSYLDETDRDWPGLGGLPKLLRSLDRAFVFDRVEETELTGQPPLPAWRLMGHWNPQRLAKLLPDAAEETVAPGGVDPAGLPPQLPERVVVYLGKDDLFPYRLEYHRDATSERAKEQRLTPWSMQLELHEVSFRGPIPRDHFKFPASLDYTDKTAAFVEELGIRDWG